MANGATQVRVRKNVKKLAGGQDELFWYAKAVADMQKRPATDPTSWRYQSGVHGYNRLSDPNGNLPEPLPPAPEQKRFWNQCQHQTWYFLPWHRGYLAYFEQIVAAAVVKAGGPPNWALPYWNYSAPDPSARLLPDAFVKPTLPDGSDNPLFVPGRNSNTNDFHIDDDTVSLECLTHSPFQGYEYAWRRAWLRWSETRFTHHGGPSGRLEDVPHNVMHDAIGGIMGNPDTAALDPIFWLHHSNIDRLWEVWTHRNPKFINPKDAAWLTGLTYELHDVSGQVQSFTPSQMQDTTTVLHGYKYDDISDPITAVPHLVAMAAIGEQMAATPQPPHLVATSGTSIALDSDRDRRAGRVPARIGASRPPDLGRGGSEETCTRLSASRKRDRTRSTGNLQGVHRCAPRRRTAESGERCVRRTDVDLRP